MGRFSDLCSYIWIFPPFAGFFPSSLTDEADTSSFDDKSASVVKLNNSTVLYLKEVDKVLALVAIFREENFTKPAMIDYNFKHFRNAINKVFQVREHFRQLAIQDKKMLMEQNGANEDAKDHPKA